MTTKRNAKPAEKTARKASKPAAKRCFREAGLPVAPERVVKQSELDALDCDAVIAELGPAVVVKPSGGGSSIGVQRLAEGSVHLLDQHPGALVAHLHAPPRSSDRAGVANARQQVGLARPEGKAGGQGYAKM